MDPKLTMFFLLVGTIIGLSHLSRENLTKMKREFDGRRWRDIVPRWRKASISGFSLRAKAQRLLVADGEKVRG
jgi:hypothetical protein